QQRVHAGKSLHEVLEQIARARIAVGLKGKHDAPTRKGATRRVERRLHLDLVMPIVVDQSEAPRRFAVWRKRNFTVALETPADAAELGERLSDRRIGYAKPGLHGDRGERVLNVVPLRKIERNVQGRGAFPQRPEAHAVSGNDLGPPN